MRNGHMKKFLLNKLEQNFKDIEKVYLSLDEIVSKKQELPKGSDWILDNFYLIQLVYKESRNKLKNEEQIVLKVIGRSLYKGYPRIYKLALDFISHTSGNIIESDLIEFINEFQREEILTLEEINNLSTVLIIALLEYIKNISLKLLNINNVWKEIDSINLSKGKSIDEMLENIHTMDSIKIERWFRKIKNEVNDFQPILDRMNRKLEYMDKNIKEILEEEYIVQSKYGLSLGYGLESLRNILNFNLEKVFESISLVEKILKKDPINVYNKMSSSSKHNYRYQIQILAKKFKVQEVFIAKQVLELSKKEWEKGNKDKTAHIGYYLLDKGRKDLFLCFGCGDKNSSIYFKKYSHYYLPIVLFSTFITICFSRYIYIIENIYWSIVSFIITFIPLLSVSISLFNYFYFKKYKPISLARIEYGEEIPKECATFVVIPTLLPSVDRVEELVKNLEVYYLSNREENIYFGIVGDFKDGDKEVTKEDKEIVNRGLKLIKELNRKYNRNENIFYFFSRKRVYSKTQEKWMGWERKRGALLEFNNLLLGEEETTFNIKSEGFKNLDIKYVITLDADTILPIDGAKKLIGTISHPLNKAIIDEERNSVKEGYGIIQPRMLVHMESSNKTLFTRIFAGAGGIDPYSGAISDIYQDLFGEGIFIGKGIYDLKVFQKCLRDEIPENMVLSHDLLEGSYIRAGLATEIELIDEYPEKYNSYIMRQHRWTRGDWQLIPWLKNKSISTLSKWKIIDNMRRSILPISLFVVLFFAPIYFPGNICTWLTIGVITLLLPIITMAVEYIWYGKFKIENMKLNGNIIFGYKTYLYQGLLFLMFLPHEARMMFDAIYRTLYRTFISKKNLLEWTTAFDMEKSLTNNPWGYFKGMKENIISSILLVTLTYMFRQDNIVISSIIGVLWLMGPLAAYMISREAKDQIETNNKDIDFLTEVGRDTWKYYKTFTNEKQNYLPPDNFQEYPYNGPANRTSPTNIGLYLISILSSRDLGFIDTSEMMKLVEKTIGTLEKMEKWEGHLYNWYNIETLEPLKPIVVSTVDSGNLVSYLIVLNEGLKEYINQSSRDNIIGDGLINRVDKLIDNTKFRPLYDEGKDLFYIGYILDEKKVIDNHYDLLASEARIASYIGVSRKEIPLKHWKSLGKPLIMEDKYISLASWTGTMFEYLMPSLVLKNYENTLLDETYKTSIKIQRDYGKSNNLPWGISESGFFAFDNQLNYQYKAFGVPRLGLKRGLKEELVVSPYSTFLALNFDYANSMNNIKRLKEEGLLGQYGFYEAIDYTKSRLPSHLDRGIIKSYMSHHQGMILAAINNFMNKDILIDRFHRNPEMKSGEFLLQERIPLNPIIPMNKEKEEEVDIVKVKEKNGKGRKYTKEDLEHMKCHLLSSSTYSMMINNRGEGFSKDEDIYINRWRKDYLANSYGQFIYINDLKDQKIWSATYAPTYKEPDSYIAEFSNGKASFKRTDGNIETKMDIFLLPEELGEVRKVSLINHGDDEALIQTTSYFEIVGEHLESDLAHPAFNNLFIETEAIESSESLLAYRRKREENGSDYWIAHGVKFFGEVEKGFQYETNRNNFVGRGNSLKTPIGPSVKGLTNTAGIVLDPIMSIGKKIRIPGKDKVDIYYITAITNNREDSIKILDKYNDINSIDMAMELACIKSQTEIGYLDLEFENIDLYEDLIPSLFYLENNNKLEYTKLLKENIKGKEGLWAQGISGDKPIFLVTIGSMEGMDTVIELINAHEYWTYRGLSIDLVILNKEKCSYYKPLYENIMEVIYSKRGNIIDSPGGIFIRNSNTLESHEKSLLYKWAKVIMRAEKGFNNEIIKKEPIEFKKTSKKQGIEYGEEDISLDLDYYNGYGGFSKDGKEYIIKLNKGLNTPLPWINVIANKNFGFIVSELGTGFTWADNSRENKLTPWYNDSLSKIPSEVIYIRDNDTGHIWNITPSPIRGENDYIITHGFGYSRFYQKGNGIEQTLTLFAPVEDSIKVNLLKLKNNSNNKRKLTLVYYIRPVLGVTDEETEYLLETDIDSDEQIFVVKNSTNSEFKDTTLFISSSEKIKSYTGDRVEFLGKIPNYENPEGIRRERFSNTTGLGYNPCSAIEIEILIPANEEKEIVFLLGEEKEEDRGYSLINKYKDIQTSKNSLEEVRNFWNEKLSKVQVKTPDNTMNYMMNGWLMYQTIACRIWGRAGFYQVGGAFGARDQIQDVTNTLYHMPELAEKQIIRNCKHQYIEGDIQHWWHPVNDSDVHKGIRSKYSDDLLWLPLGVAKYISVIGEDKILNKEVYFIESPVLKETEYERYETPSKSDEIGTVYEHCIRAIEKSLNFGEKGLPLMGSGDWNDGMNKVGYKGKGESVWLGWFLATVLKDFIPVCEKMKDYKRAEKYRKVIPKLKDSIESNAWDGEWYKRAFFDDGTPIGSKENRECTIDSISQSWAVISELGDIERSKQALKFAEDYLVNEEEGIIGLLTPPFNNTDKDPGYIKSYVPGVRENGGQYTHAATWLIKAFAMLGNGEKAYNLFQLINPINHSKSLIECSNYKVEPYVIAADVYTNPQHLGRGGWTWYTGSSGWMYIVGLEDILGFSKKGDKLFIKPSIPKQWENYSIKYKYENTIYNIEVENSLKIRSKENIIEVDGTIIDEEYITLFDDGLEHFVKIKLLFGN